MTLWSRHVTTVPPAPSQPVQYRHTPTRPHTHTISLSLSLTRCHARVTHELFRWFLVFGFWFLRFRFLVFGFWCLGFGVLGFGVLRFGFLVFGFGFWVVVLLRFSVWGLW